jgi:hypothetical protein
LGVVGDRVLLQSLVERWYLTGQDSGHLEDGPSVRACSGPLDVSAKWRTQARIRLAGPGSIPVSRGPLGLDIARTAASESRGGGGGGALTIRSPEA